MTRRSGITLLLALGLAWAVITACQSQPISGSVDGRQAQALMKNLGERLIILDVRTAEEFAQGHIPGSWLIPLAELETRMGELPGNRPILLVCRAGVRSAQAYNILSGSRPELRKPGLWHLKTAIEYEPDGSFSFQ
jgi:hypothetical protein